MTLVDSVKPSCALVQRSREPSSDEAEGKPRRGPRLRCNSDRQGTALARQHFTSLQFKFGLPSIYRASMEAQSWPRTTLSTHSAKYSILPSFNPAMLILPLAVR